MQERQARRSEDLDSQRERDVAPTLKVGFGHTEGICIGRPTVLLDQDWVFTGPPWTGTRTVSYILVELLGIAKMTHYDNFDAPIPENLCHPTPQEIRKLGYGQKICSTRRNPRSWLRSVWRRYHLHKRKNKRLRVSPFQLAAKGMKEEDYIAAHLPSATELLNWWTSGADHYLNQERLNDDLREWLAPMGHDVPRSVRIGRGK